MAKIRETSDYDRFVQHNFNRDVARIGPLEASMRQYGFLDPYSIHVREIGSGRYEIVAGHHRFHVAKKIGIPVKFIVCNAAISVHELEHASRPWTMRDYLASYVRQGRAAYISVKEYIDATGIGVACAVPMLAGELASSTNLHKSFKAGTYKIGDVGPANIVAQVVNYCRSHGVSFATNSKFVMALSRVSFLPEFDVEQMNEKIEKYSYELTKQRNLDAYVQMIEDVYNRHQKSGRVPLAYLADEAARTRNAVLRKQKQKLALAN